MLTLEIYANETVAVADIFGTVAVAIRRWAEKFITFADAEDDEAESETEEEEDNKAPPTLGILVQDSIDTNDIFGK